MTSIQNKPHQPQPHGAGKSLGKTASPLSGVKSPSQAHANKTGQSSPGPHASSENKNHSQSWNNHEHLKNQQNGVNPNISNAQREALNRAAANLAYGSPQTGGGGSPGLGGGGGFPQGGGISQGGGSPMFGGGAPQSRSSQGGGSPQSGGAHQGGRSQGGQSQQGNAAPQSQAGSTPGANGQGSAQQTGTPSQPSTGASGNNSQSNGESQLNQLLQQQGFQSNDSGGYSNNVTGQSISQQQYQNMLQQVNSGTPADQALQSATQPGGSTSGIGNQASLEGDSSLEGMSAMADV